jgi:hypothetical protein
LQLQQAWKQVWKDAELANLMVNEEEREYAELTPHAYFIALYVSAYLGWDFKCVKSPKKPWCTFMRCQRAGGCAGFLIKLAWKQEDDHAPSTLATCTLTAGYPEKPPRNQLPIHIDALCRLDSKVRRPLTSRQLPRWRIHVD